MSSNQLAREALPQKLKRQIKQAMGPWGVFFEGFMRNPVMVGSIIPSSRYTIDKMLAPVNWDTCRLFVEYGPGVGTFCRPVLEKLRRDAQLIVIDTNPLYIDYLRATIRDSRFIAVLGSAADVEEIVAAHGHESADYVLSGLPFSTLPDGVGPAIASATYRVLRAGGAFLVYQFTPPRARECIADYFADLDHGFELRNIPPSFLSWGWKERASAG